MSHHLVVLVKEEVHTEEEVHMEEEVEDMVMEDMVMENIVTCKEDMVTVKVQEVEAEVEEDQEDMEEDMVVDHLKVDLVLHLTLTDHQVLEEEEEDIEVNVVLVMDHLEWWKNSSVDLWVDHTVEEKENSEKENSEKLKNNSFKIWKLIVLKKNSLLRKKLGIKRNKTCLMNNGEKWNKEWWKNISCKWKETGQIIKDQKIISENGDIMLLRKFKIKLISQFHKQFHKLLCKLLKS